MKKILFIFLIQAILFACASNKETAKIETNEVSEVVAESLQTEAVQDSAVKEGRSTLGNIWYFTFGWIFDGLGKGLGYSWDKTESFRSYYNTLYNAKKLFEKNEREYLARLKTESLNQNSQKNQNKRLKSDLSRNEKNNFDKVIEKCSKILEIYPTSKHRVEALFLIGKSYYYKWEFEKSVTKFEELKANFPKSNFVEKSTLWQGKSLFKRRSSEPIEADKIQFTKQAEDVLLELVTQSKKDEILGEAYFTLAEISLVRLNLEKAVERFKKASEFLDEKDKKIKIHFAVGDALIELEKYEEAITEYKKIEKLSPGIEDEFDKDFKEGRALKLLGKLEEAQKIFSDLLKLEVESFGEEKLFPLTEVIFQVNPYTDNNYTETETPRTERSQSFDNESKDLAGGSDRIGDSQNFNRNVTPEVEILEELIPDRIWFANSKVSFYLLKDSTVYNIRIARKNANQTNNKFIEEPLKLTTSTNSKDLFEAIPMTTTESSFWGIIFENNRPKFASFDQNSLRLSKTYLLPNEAKVTPQTPGALTYGNNWLWYLTPENDVYRVNPITGLSEPSAIFRLYFLQNSKYTKNITFSSNFLWVISETKDGIALVKINPANGKNVAVFPLPNELKSIRSNIFLSSNSNNEFYIIDQERHFTYRVSLEKDLTNVDLSQQNLKNKFPQVRFNFSEIYLKEGNYPEALGQLQEVIYTYPNSAFSTEAYYRLGQINENLFFDFPQALENYSKASKQQSHPEFADPSKEKENLLNKFLEIANKTSRTQIELDSLITDSLFFASKLDSLINLGEVTTREDAKELFAQIVFDDSVKVADSIAVLVDTTFADSLGVDSLDFAETDSLLTDTLEIAEIDSNEVETLTENENPEFSEEEFLEFESLLLKGWDLRKIRSADKFRKFTRIDFFEDGEETTQQNENFGENLENEITPQDSSVLDSSATKQEPTNNSFFAKIGSKREKLASEKFGLAEYLFIDFAKLDSAKSFYKEVLEITKDSTLVAKTLYSLRAVELLQDSSSTFVDSLENNILENHPKTIFAKEILKERGVLFEEEILVTESEEIDSAKVAFLEAENSLWETQEYETAIRKFGEVVKDYPESELAAKSQFAIAWTYENKIQDKNKALEEYTFLSENFNVPKLKNFALAKIATEADSTMIDSLKNVVEDTLASVPYDSLTQEEKMFLADRTEIPFDQIELKPMPISYATGNFNESFRSAFFSQLKGEERRDFIKAGDIQIEFSISPMGELQDLKFLNEVSENLQEIIDEKINNLRFTPGAHQGKPVKTIQIFYEFKSRF
ncbi:MAG: hypothetical protein DWQ06_08855 [Calditrichaeota bacterium]|nr:MAG: hypothetical protein DWQ06_08855 [Calditrichota bacterium]